MYKIIPLETLSKIIVTDNCGESVTVTFKSTNITITKLNNVVSITNSGA